MAEQRRIVITGVTRGLGLAMATAFIERGHTVSGCGTSKAKIAELQKRWPKPHRFDAVDVSDDRAVATWADSVLADGPVDLLINNAAVMNVPVPLWKAPAEEFDRLMKVNVSGVTNVIRHFVPAMLKRKSGVIVNLSSGWGRSVSPEVAPYCASKFAIEGLTKALAADLEEHVPGTMAAIPLNPGIIDTDMLRQAWSDGAANYPKPEKWAERAVPFLLKLTAKDNGHSLTVPGG
jgi:NAD(P)-dependent dehydrogenase (short-subunit alcohol dehydrogenase family)